MGLVRRALLALAVLLSVGLPRAQGGADREYRIKAVFLFHFTQFVDWPEKALKDKGAPFVVGILGSDPFNAYLEEVVKGEKVKDHPIVVERYARIEDARRCQVLFIGSSAWPRPGPIFDAVKGTNILTVGETEGFCRQGGMFCFVNRAGRIRFEINLEAAKGAELNVSSKLLRLADVLPAGKD
jgi:hypothetical protein